MLNFISSYFADLSTYEISFLIIGLLAQIIFASRFLVQWIYSEKQGKSVIPISFWYLSIFGSFGLLIYAISRQDPIIILGQSCGLIIYLRNLYLIKKNNLK
tara:strand:+ start:338 stop:640 length:303 start_codon:yes stop_codon:yes gene_type:complete